MKTIEQKLREIMRATGWKQTRLAEHLGVTQATVSRWFSGSEPEGPNRDGIMALYEELLDSGPAIDAGSVVPLMGYIGAGAEIEPEFEQTPPDGLDQIWVPFPLPDEMIALEVRGISMLPIYKPGHVIVCYAEQKKPLEQFFGEEAAVKTSDGRRFLKTVTRGVDGVNLMSFNAPLIENVQLDWIGEIFAVLPKASIRHIERKGGVQGRLL